MNKNFYMILLCSISLGLGMLLSFFLFRNHRVDYFKVSSHAYRKSGDYTAYKIIKLNSRTGETWIYDIPDYKWKRVLDK